MESWRDQRRMLVVTACTSANGTPDFALSEIEVTFEEYENGVHYDRVQERLIDRGYEPPFVHFDEVDAPAFLIPAVKAQLGWP